MKISLVLTLAALAGSASLAFQAKRPVDYANALVGTAPLDDPKLIGNAPPPGEELYTGMTSPGAVLPHGLTNLGPVNKNLDLSYGAGVGMSYNYLHRTMLGFTSPMQGVMLMPVVGDWTVPPERSAAEIADGGQLVFQMGPAPNRNWGAAADAAPPSMSAAH